MHCKSVYPKLHSHGRLLAVRFCILPFFFLKSRQKERNKSNWERKKAKCRLLSQLIVASVNAALWDHDMVSYKYKFLSRQSAVILRLSSALWCHNEDYSLSQVWLFFFLYVFSHQPRFDAIRCEMNSSAFCSFYFEGFHKSLEERSETYQLK